MFAKHCEVNKLERRLSKTDSWRESIQDLIAVVEVQKENLRELFGTSIDDQRSLITYNIQIFFLGLSVSDKLLSGWSLKGEPLPITISSNDFWNENKNTTERVTWTYGVFIWLRVSI